MPNNVLYYTLMEKLTLEVGDYVGKKSLLLDLEQQGLYTSPDSVKVLSKYYDGDINVLRTSYKSVAGKCNKFYNSIRDILVAEGRFDKADSDKFVALLKKTGDVCDFREKVRDWARAEIRKEQKKPGSSTFYDLGDLIGRYDDLLRRRRNRGK